MNHDALIDELSAIVEITKLGAVIYRNAEGEYHRTAGPAVVTHTGEQHWFQNGVPHRTDGPAVIYSNGALLWYRNGVLHRTDGAACILNGIRYWFLNGEEVSEEEFNRRIALGEYLEP